TTSLCVRSFFTLPVFNVPFVCSRELRTRPRVAVETLNSSLFIVIWKPECKSHILTLHERLMYVLRKHAGYYWPQLLAVVLFFCLAQTATIVAQETPPANFKIAFIGDQGLGPDSVA